MYAQFNNENGTLQVHVFHNKKPFVYWLFFLLVIYIKCALPGIGYANHMIDICEYDLQELVGDDGASVSKTK